MKKLLFIVFFILLAKTASAFCGIEPIRPIPPLGCSDLVGVCVCDENGDNCFWQWQCVR